MIIVDTNVIAYLFIRGELSENAKRLLIQDPEWISPYLWCSEFRNVLAHYMRKGDLSYKDAVLLMEEAENLLHNMEYQTKSERVLELVSKSDCSAYDCEFVALAYELNLNLYTSDKRLLKVFPDITVSLREI